MDPAAAAEEPQPGRAELKQPETEKNPSNLSFIVLFCSFSLAKCDQILCV